MRKNIPFYVSISALLFISTSSFAQLWNSVGSEIPGEFADDQFGRTTAISDDGLSIASAAWNNDNGANNAGAVYVYDFDGVNWVQRGIEIMGAAADDMIGFSIDLNSDGTVLAIGNPLSDGTGFNESGKIEIYKWDGTIWSPKGLIAPSIADIRIGTSIALDSIGDAIVLGAPGNGNVTPAGRPYVYDWNGSIWIERGSFPTLSGDSFFGSTVDIASDGNTVIVGAKNGGNLQAGTGEVWMYSWNGSAWIDKGSGLSGAFETEFGKCVAMSSSGNVIVVGNVNESSVSIYEWNGTNWSLKGIEIIELTTGDEFGTSVDINAAGNIVCIGAWRGDNGAVVDCGYVETYLFNGVDWISFGGTLYGDATSDVMGWTCRLSASGYELITSVHGSDLNTTNGGVVKVFEIDSSVGLLEAELLNISIYPNPSKDYMVIRSDALISHIRLIDATGKEVLYLTDLNSTTIELNLEKFSGFYMVEIISNKSREMRKILLK
jgi:hypothetical protein